MENIIRIDNFLTEGHKRAMDAKGLPDALRINLDNIRFGHLVSEEQEIGATEEEKKRINEKIQEIEADILSLTREISVIEKDDIEKEQQKIEGHEKRIQEVKDKKFLDPDKPRFSFFLFSIISIFLIVLSIYLFSFYVVILYDALTGGGGENIIPKPEKFMEAISSNPLLIISPMAVISVGFCLHWIYASRLKKWHKIISMFFLVLGGLSFDILLAALIHSKVNLKRSLLGEETIEWFANPNFWIIIFMGFGAYILWSILVHALVTEWKKRDISIWEAQQIKDFGVKIEECKQIISEYKERKNREIPAKIDRLKAELENQKNRLTTTRIPKGILKKRVTDFYSGWIKVLSEEYQQSTRNACNEVFEKFNKEIDNEIEKD